MKKLAYVLSALVAVMLLIGLVYTLWSTNVLVSGTIETGTVEGMWVSAVSNDEGVDPGYDKDVGGVIFDGLGTDTLIVVVDNTYPCYNATITAVYRYTGTVPAIVNETVITTIGWTPSSGYGANDGPVWLQITHDAPVGRQLHQGDEITVVIKVHVEQCADQDASYPFALEMELIQWNEYVPPAQAITETVRLNPNKGCDTTDFGYQLKSQDLNRLKQSDDDRYRTKSTWSECYSEFEYLDIWFEKVTLPAGASIDSVVLYFEWNRPSHVDNARIRVYVGPTLMGTINLSPLPAPGQDRTEVIDLKALGVDTVAEINDLKVRFQATDGWGAYTYHDLAVVEVKYTYTP
ncbi:MAG: hypothetical protein QW701_02215 [Candidatus Nezhaarchaeales archaeon]